MARPPESRNAVYDDDEDEGEAAGDSPEAAHRVFKKVCMDYGGHTAEDYGPMNPPLPRNTSRPLSEVAGRIQKGGLHRSLGIPMGQKIPAAKIAAAAAKGGKVGRQARLAQTFAKYRK